MPRWLINLSQYVLVVALPVVLVLANVLIFMNPAWLAYEYSKPGFPKAELFSDKDRLYFGSESIEYIRGTRTLDQFKALGVYVDREIKHMVDVRVLVDQVKIVLPVLVVLMLAALIALAYQPATRANAARGLFGGAGFTLLLFGAVGVFAATGFDTFFTDFHRIFFQGNTWLFYTTDSLIQYYPLTFWFDTSIALVSLTIAEAIVVGAIGWYWNKRMSQ